MWRDAYQQPVDTHCSSLHPNVRDLQHKLESYHEVPWKIYDVSQYNAIKRCDLPFFLHQEASLMLGSFTLEERVRLALTSTRWSTLCPRSSFILSTMKPSLTMMSPWWSSATRSLSPTTSDPSVWQATPASSIPQLPAGQQAGPNITVSNFRPVPLAPESDQYSPTCFFKSRQSCHTGVCIYNMLNNRHISHEPMRFLLVDFSFQAHTFWSLQNDWHQIVLSSFLLQ